MGCKLSPSFTDAAGLAILPKPCKLGVGSHGGKSRGVGSGSRLRLYHCQCEPPVKVRAGTGDSDWAC